MYQKINLDYNYNSLEPYLDSQTIYIHYNKHYLTYLNKLNNLLKNNNYNFRYNLSQLVDKIDIFPLKERGEILYNLGGVLNHNLYFYNISNKSNTTPVGMLKEDINKQFGSFDNFKKEFITTANNLKGSGYTFLTINKNNNLFIINTSNQDTPYSYGLTPIISLDLWEHAYYLVYKNNRQEYIKQWFNIVDFKKINDFYQKIKKP